MKPRKWLVLADFAWTRRGLKRFARAVEMATDKGWIMDEDKYPRYERCVFGLRWHCRAILYRFNPED